MAGDNLSQIIDQNRISESKSSDAIGNLSGLSLGMPSRIARVRA
jgi:hypothetical protein